MTTKFYKAQASSLLLALVMPFTAAAAAPVTTAPSVAPTNLAASGAGTAAAVFAEKKAQEQTAEKRKQINAEALAAINETRNALMSLDSGKNAEALAALERATGKLELILARDPAVALAPTTVGATTFNLLADLDRVKELRRQAQRLLDDGQVQAARLILDALASETVISVSNIPLVTYPAAIKATVKLIDDGKQEDAKKVLQTALNTLVVTETVIPLPVVGAQESLKEAEKLAEKPARSADETNKMNGLMAEARRQLEFAEVLGYGTKRGFKELYSQMDEIKSKASNGKSGFGFFDKIKASISDMLRFSQAGNKTANKTRP